MKKIIIFSFLVINIPLYVFPQIFPVEEKDFTDPEEAVRYFIAAVMEQDIPKALEACTINQRTVSYDLRAFCDSHAPDSCSVGI
jgi:hypothetical protein